MEQTTSPSSVPATSGAAAVPAPRTGPEPSGVPDRRSGAHLQSQRSRGGWAAGADDRADEHAVRRGLGALGLVGVALIHLLDLPGKLSETPYLGVAYIGLIVAALGAAELLVRKGSRLAWSAAGAIAASTLAGYVVNRTVGMPGAMDDIGNWLEPLGLASLFVEGVVVLLAVTALLRTRR